MFATNEVDFVTEGMKGNMVKCRTCYFVQDMQTTLAVPNMDFFMTLQLKASIRRLKSQKVLSYAPY